MSAVVVNRQRVGQPVAVREREKKRGIATGEPATEALDRHRVAMAGSEFLLGNHFFAASYDDAPLSHDTAIVLRKFNDRMQSQYRSSIGAKATEGLGITLLGYGCTQPGGTGGNDGILRVGNSAIIGFSQYDMVSRMPNGAALCYGDSGGPAFVIEDGNHLLLGINSKGNISDTNYNTRTDISQSQSFLTTFAQQNTVEICGVNKDCTSVTPPPPPTCNIKADFILDQLPCHEIPVKVFNGYSSLHIRNEPLSRKLEL